MLVLSRKRGEEIVIGDNIRLTVLAICGRQVRLGLSAPEEVPIYRDELYAADRRPRGRLIQRKARSHFLRDR
jgi:carbon storage regulator